MITDSKIEQLHGAGYRPYDLIIALILSLFALFSFMWPHTQGAAGSASAVWDGVSSGFTPFGLALGGYLIPRGFLVGTAFALLALLVLVLAPRDYSRSAWPIRFVRAFYPQALFGFIFMESIKLSALAFGGRSHDAFFAGLDLTIFGMQPAIVFSDALKGLPWWNELMFGSYFSYYIILAITPWLPWFRGDEREAEREISLLSAYMLIVFSFYVFFRVQGPKYWVPELAAVGFADFSGGPITAFMRGVLERSILSGSAFPSSHAAGALMLCFFVAKSNRPLLPLYVILLVLISLSAVYIRAHWAIDILGGLLVALALTPLLNALHQRLTRLVQRRSEFKPMGYTAIE